MIFRAENSFRGIFLHPKNLKQTQSFFDAHYTDTKRNIRKTQVAKENIK